jgi:hypothetical protein
MYIYGCKCKQKLLEKNIKREKKTGRPHLKNFKKCFLLKKKIKLSFFLAFLDQIYPLTYPLYVINFSKKLLSIYLYNFFSYLDIFSLDNDSFDYRNETLIINRFSFFINLF